MMAIRVLLVDDHAVIRDALSLLLDTQPDITIVGKAEDGVRPSRWRVSCAPTLPC
jgi:chemotaxis response regulator CheB